MTHPIHQVLLDAAAGVFPASDGGVDVLPPDTDGTRAIIAFTGHAFVLTDAPAADIAQRTPDGGFGPSLDPAFQVWLAGDTHVVGNLDAVLVRHGVGGGGGRPTTEHDAHPRVQRARSYRRAVDVYADPHGVVMLGTGLAGRRELALELFDPATAPRGTGRRLIAEGLAHASPDELVWAQVTPGNARSLRAFLAAGFVPVGSEVLFAPRLRLAPGVTRVGRYNAC